LSGSRICVCSRGGGQFVDDLAPIGAVNAVILRSSVAHGRIRSIDTAAALARPGVLAVLTAADLGNAIIADYLMPTASDFPSIRAVALEPEPSPNNPLGAKGAGEGGIIPVGGVIANAVANALGPLGVELRELPLSPPRILAPHQAIA
jgi:CO/xanthine dehydrogenase Mo-binding subunit